MKTTTFALSLLLSQYAIVDGQIANASQRRVSPTDRFANPSHKQHRTLRTARTLEDDGSMSLATSMSMMAVEPEVKDMFETTEESIEAVEPAYGPGGGFDPADYSGSSKGGKMYKSKATKMFKTKSGGDAKAEKSYTSKATKKESAAKAEKESQGKAEKMPMPSRKLKQDMPIAKAEKASKAEKVSKASKAKGEKMR